MNSRPSWWRLSIVGRRRRRRRRRLLLRRLLHRLGLSLAERKRGEEEVKEQLAVRGPR